MLAPRARNPARVGYVIVSSARHNTILWKNPHIRFMKQELPLAVALLAAGSLLWLTQLAEPADSSGVVLDSNVSINESIQREQAAKRQMPRLTDPNIALPIRVYRDRGLLEEDTNSGNSGNSQVALITYEEEIPSTVWQEETSSVVRKRSATKKSWANPNQSPLRFLLDVSNSLANSMPFEVNVSMSGTIFDQKVEAVGTYYQMGQGTQKSSLALKFANDSNPVSIHQLCDGNIVFKLQEFSHNGLVDRKDTLEFVNLDVLRESMADTTSALIPTGWVASGGIACTIRHLSAAFDFEEKKRQSNGDVLLRGVLNAKTVAKLTGKTSLTEEPDWGALPSHFPHTVELVLGVDSTLSYVPRRMSFSRFPNRESQMTNKELINIGFSRFQVLTDLSDDSFRAKYIDVEKVDVTADYIARMKKIGFSSESQSAEKSNETFER
jgi:hypothetical protein